MVKKLKKGYYYVLDKEFPETIDENNKSIFYQIYATNYNISLTTPDGNQYYTYNYQYKRLGRFSIGYVYLAVEDGILVDDGSNFIEVTDEEKLACFSPFKFKLDENVKTVINNLEKHGAKIKLTPFSTETFKCFCGFTYYSGSNIAKTPLEAVINAYNIMKKKKITYCIRNKIRWPSSVPGPSTRYNQL